MIDKSWSELPRGTRFHIDPAEWESMRNTDRAEWLRYTTSAMGAAQSRETPRLPEDYVEHISVFSDRYGGLMYYEVIDTVPPPYRLPDAVRKRCQFRRMLTGTTIAWSGRWVQTVCRLNGVGWVWKVPGDYEFLVVVIPGVGQALLQKIASVDPSDVAREEQGQEDHQDQGDRAESSGSVATVPPPAPAESEDEQYNE